MKGSAVFDKEKRYRYSLARKWDASKGKVVFIMLNPSLAGAQEDDKTTRRCINFAKKFGYGSLEIVNIFAYIATNHQELKDLGKKEAIGSGNELYLIRALNSADKIIAAWGENCRIHEGDREIEKLIDGYNVDCLGELTKSGFPRHPLYLPKDVELRPYKRSEKKIRKFISIAPNEKGKTGEGTLLRDGKEIHDDSWMWCESCLEDFRYEGMPLCQSCFEQQMREFKDFLIEEYHLGESSANDYVGRFKGIVKRGIYKGEQQMTPSLRAVIEKEFANSKNHYILTVKRYIEFQVGVNNSR